MSSSKLKKKSKSSKIPEPIKIKKEDDHLMYPMEHYVDDRVELIRQLFSSLKPKTITNLAPDFLKKQSLEVIQEQCLNEILGISKKRLLSIINSTKCPTDTETSSEDEVNAVAEHISLEEISSDSDIAESKGSKRTGQKKQPKKRQQTEDGKQFSVLELLELQARARAIRSQLALEPVDKIEVKTDSEEDGPPRQKPPSAAAVRRKSPKATNGGSSSRSKPENSTLTVIIPNGGSTSAKRIKLKRNFRKQNQSEEPTEESNKTAEQPVPKEEPRSPSPDVIPIVSVPETLCISDSDDSEQKAANEPAPPEESVKPKSPEKLEILSVVNITAASTKDPETTDEPKSSTSPEQLKPPESEEEGEIVEEDKKEKESVDNTNSEKESLSKTEPTPADQEDVNKESEESTEKKETEKEPLPEAQDQKIEPSASDDDDNDDVISLEGGDYVNDMKEHMEINDVQEVTQKQDIICLDDSSEDEAAKKKSESWNDRWLNSRKVSKVLATSRLGNKVRNKIKESKKAMNMKKAEAALEKSQEKPQQVVFVSKHELGSVEHYKELLENMKKKTTD